MSRSGGVLTARLAALVPLAVTALVAPSPARGQQAEPWPIREFQVVAVEPAGEVEGGIDDWVEEMARIIRTETDYDPDFPPIWNKPTVPDALFHVAKQEIEAVLNEAALKLEAWGFLPPHVEPVVRTEAGVDAYRVYLVTGRPAAGRYHREPCAFGIREPVLVLNADVVLDSNGSLTDFGVQTVAHELVHAAQHSYPVYFCGSAYPGQWVTEGTARAIGFDVLRQLRGAASFRGMYEAAWGARMYSERLPVPLSDRGYRTSAFWRFLAEAHLSWPAWPGPGATWPVDYSYLPPLLGRDFSPRDCYAEGDPCDAELRWLDAGLTEQFMIPLRDLYARFLQAYAQYGEERVHSTEGGTPATWRKNWLGRSFAHEDGMGCPKVRLGPEAEERQREFVVSRFADVAARCWEIELDGFKNAVTLAVTAFYRPGTEALLKQLTAVMADDSRRVDEAHIRTVADVPETTWYYNHFGTADTTVFLLTNVADEPDATSGLANLSVTFTAFETNAMVGVSGPGVSAGSAGSGGPALFGTAGPDFEVTDWWYSVEGSDQVAEIQAAYGQPAPPGNACWVSLTLTSQDANGERLIHVPLHGWVPAPLAPGVWPLVPGHLAGESPFGVFQTNVGLSCEFGGCYEYDWAASSGWDEDDDPPAVALDTLPYLHMTDFHGEVEIQDVSRSHIAGRFDITASADAKYVGLNLNGVFNVTLGGPRSVEANRITMPEDHQCAPADRDSRSGAGRRGGGGDQGGGDERADDAGRAEPRGEDPGEPDEGPPGMPGGDAAGQAGEDPGQAGQDPPARGEPRAERDAREGELRGPELILDLVESQRSVLRSEPQAVRGTGSVGGVDVSSTSYDLTVALPIFGCSVKPPEGVSGLELVEYQRTYNQWLQSSRNTGNELLFDFTAADVRLDAASGEFVLELESPEGGVTLRGSTENALALRAGGPGTLIGEGSDLTLEMTRGEDTFSCLEPMGVSFTVSEAQ